MLLMSGEYGEDPNTYQGHFFDQPGHLLARCSGVGGAAAASGIMPAQADWPDDPLASNSVGVWCVGIAR